MVWAASLGSVLFIDWLTFFRICCNRGKQRSMSQSFQVFWELLSLGCCRM